MQKSKKSAVHRLDARLQFLESMFLKQTSNSLPLSPLGHSDGFASCKARRVLISASLPKTPFPRKGAILLGLPPLDPVGGYAPATPFLIFTRGFSTACQPCIALMHGFYVIGCSFQRSAYPLRSFRHAVLQAIHSYCSRLLRPCREFLRFRC